MRLLIVGCGYLGTRLAQIAREKPGTVVAGAARNPTTRQEWQSRGYEVFEADVSDIDSLHSVVPFAPTHVVYCVAGGRAGGAGLYRKLYFEGLKHVLAVLEQFAPVMAHVFFTSSTSVYEEKNGEWVDEESPANPDSPTAAVLREAEIMLLQQRHVHTTVLRVAGIYGPGRGVLVQRAREVGKAPVEDDPRRWLNFIHVDDIALSILSLAETALSRGQIYNLCDDEPIRLGDYYSWIRRQAGLTTVQFAPGAAKPLNKRISNLKLKNTTGFRCRYPSIREGLAGAVGG